MTSICSMWIRQSFKQIFYLENMISTPRRCPEPTSQTFQQVWLPNQGTFRWSGSAMSYVSQSCSCSAQQKIPALNGKSNSATREPQREQTLLSLSCLGRIFSLLPTNFWVYVWHNEKHKQYNTNIQLPSHCYTTPHYLWTNRILLNSSVLTMGALVYPHGPEYLEKANLTFIKHIIDEKYNMAAACKEWWGDRPAPVIYRAEHAACICITSEF